MTHSQSEVTFHRASVPPDMATFQSAFSKGEVFINPSIVFALEGYSIDEPPEEPWTVITSNAGARVTVKGTVMQVRRALRGER